MNIIISESFIDTDKYPNAEKYNNGDVIRVLQVLEPNSPIFSTLDEGIEWYKSLDKKDRAQYLSYFNDAMHLLFYSHDVSTVDKTTDLDGFKYHMRKNEVLSTDECYSFNFKTKKWNWEEMVSSDFIV